MQHGNRFKTLALSTVAALALAPYASGELLYYDSFSGGSASVGSNLSTADSANWTHSGGSVEPLVNDSGSLTYPGLPAQTDIYNAKYDGSSPTGNSSHEFSSDGITDGTLYFSMLMKVPLVDANNTSAPGGRGFSTGGNLTNGSFMAGFDTVSPGTAPGTNTTAAALCIRSGDGTQFSSTYQLGVGFTTNNPRTWYTTSNGPATNFTTGENAETVLVVVKLTLDSTTPTNDMAQLFINPTLSEAEPTAQATSPFNASFVANTGVRSFFLRNNSVEPDSMLVDELRIGTTWSDLTAVPEPASMSLLVLGGLALGARRRRR
jgi:hypothetical protein